MSTVAEQLRAARAIYEANPSHAPFGSLNPPGTACLTTAIDRIAVPEFKGEILPSTFPAHIALGRVIGAEFRTDFIIWNAEHTTAEALAAFDTAIENEQAREAEWTARPAAGVPDRLPVA